MRIKCVAYWCGMRIVRHKRMAIGNYKVNGDLDVGTVLLKTTQKKAQVAKSKNDSTVYLCQQMVFFVIFSMISVRQSTNILHWHFHPEYSVRERCATQYAQTGLVQSLFTRPETNTSLAFMLRVCINIYTHFIMVNKSQVYSQLTFHM